MKTILYKLFLKIIENIIMKIYYFYQRFCCAFGFFVLKQTLVVLWLCYATVFNAGISEERAIDNVEITCSPIPLHMQICKYANKKIYILNVCLTAFTYQCTCSGILSLVLYFLLDFHAYNAWFWALKYTIDA